LARRSLDVLRVAFVSAAVLEAIVTMAIAVVATYVGLTLLGYVHVPGLPDRMSLRTGLYLLLITPLYFQPMRTLAAAYHERGEALAAADALAPLLAVDAHAQPPRSTSRLARQAVAVEARDVALRFPGGETPALEQVTFTIAPGERLGVTGVSGAGKSTLLRLLAGDLAPSSGSVLVDGVPAVVVPRSTITWLGQHAYLFPGTFAENVALGRPTTDRGEIAGAARAAGLGPLLLLDEPTAHPDTRSEGEIIEVILRVAEGATAVIATHSPAVLAACCRVIALDRGRLLVEAPTERMAELAEVGR
jgi:ATP-binding cassette subfamily C protein CydD